MKRISLAIIGCPLTSALVMAELSARGVPVLLDEPLQVAPGVREFRMPELAELPKVITYRDQYDGLTARQRRRLEKKARLKQRNGEQP